MLHSRSIFRCHFLYIVALLRIAQDSSTLCYTLNPRSHHPNGPLPTKGQARHKLPAVWDALESTRDGDNAPLILIDGNNIRNSFGYRSVSALNLTQMLSHWVDTKASASKNIAHVICLWDGGGAVACDWANSTLAISSGPDGNADDVLVQCCAFLYRQKYSRNIFVFTSDANLANRCNMQMTDAKFEPSSSTMTEISHYIHHSIYLCLLLNDDAGLEQDLMTPDWERHERRSSVDELQSQLSDQQKEMKITRMRHSTGNSKVMEDVKEWISSGRPGLEIGRVTKGGSVMYQMES